MCKQFEPLQSALAQSGLVCVNGAIDTQQKRVHVRLRECMCVCTCVCVCVCVCMYVRVSVHFCVHTWCEHQIYVTK